MDRFVALRTLPSTPPSLPTTKVQSAGSATATTLEYCAPRTDPHIPRTRSPGSGSRQSHASSPPVRSGSATAKLQNTSAPHSENSEIGTPQCDSSKNDSRDTDKYEHATESR